MFPVGDWTIPPLAFWVGDATICGCGPVRPCPDARRWRTDDLDFVTEPVRSLASCRSVYSYWCGQPERSLRT